MKKVYLALLQIVVFVLCTTQLQAQNEIPDNKGKEFWVMFNQNLGSSSLSLFITGDIETSGKVELPDGSTEDFMIVPGTISTIPIPSSLMANIADGIEDKGIRIIADDEITVYGLNQLTATTDAFLALPKDILDTEYLIMSYKNGNRASSQSGLLGVVGVEDNTEITIIPSSNAGSRTAGVPYTITLDEGQTYQLQATGSSSNDLTGTFINSTKPVAVFGGHVCADIPPNKQACDHLIEQMPPTSSFGQKFVTVPLATRTGGDIFRVLAANDGTKVSVKGTDGFSLDFTLDRSEFEEIDVPSNVFTEINVLDNSGSILVAQFSKGSTTDGVTSDPFMMLIPPFEQFQNGYTVTTPATGFSKHFINLTVPSSQIGAVNVDGAPVPASDFTAIASSGFSGAQVEVVSGTHNLNGALPFGAFMYGFGSFDSYGYPGGQALGEVADVNEIVLSIDAVVKQGGEYCFSAKVSNDIGEPIVGVRVDFSIEGANTEVGFAVTNSEGVAEFCYTPENAGNDTIKASIGGVSDETTITIEAAVPSSLTLEPETVTVTAGEEICITGTVFDQFGDPLQGIEVFTEVDGEEVGSGISDENGEVEYCFTPTESGNVNIVCFYGGGERVTAVVNVVGDNPASFTLIDSQTDTDLFQILDGGEYAVEDLPELLAIRFDPASGSPGSIVFDLSGPFFHRKTETNAPYAIFGNVGSDYTGRIFPPGDYTLTATPYSQGQGRGTAGAASQVNFKITLGNVPDDLAIIGFDLYDAFSDAKIMDLTDGMVIDLGTLDHNDLTVLINTLPDFIGSVMVELEGPVQNMRIENNKPYTLFENNSINYYGRAFVAGSYTLRATPYTQKNAGGAAGTPLEIMFNVEGTPPAANTLAMDPVVYPAPFREGFSIDGKRVDGNLSAKLYNLQGQPIMLTTNPKQGGVQVSAPNSLREGLYILKVYDKGQLVKTMKIQKRN